MINQTQILKRWQELPWPEIRLKANKHLPQFVLLMLIILLTQTFAELTWALISPDNNSVVSITNRKSSERACDDNQQTSK